MKRHPLNPLAQEHLDRATRRADAQKAESAHSAFIQAGALVMGCMSKREPPHDTLQVRLQDALHSLRAYADQSDDVDWEKAIAACDARAKIRRLLKPEERNA